MAEYWVSQAKKHCDFCKCWIADNKPSRDFHERGKRHQDNVKKKIEEVRKSSIIKAQKEEEMNDSLREMNENAMKALKKDLMANPSLASQYGIKLKPKEPENLPEYGPSPRPESSADDKDDSASDSEDASSTEEMGETPAATVTSTLGTWHMAASDQGYPYYWNDITSEVSWVPPPAYIAQQAGQGTSQVEPQAHSRTPSPEPPVKKKKKRSKELEEPEVIKETEKQRSKDPEEPVVKKPKTEKPEPVVVADIPLPCDIPLPPPPGTEEVEDDKTELKEAEEESNTSDEDVTEAKPRHPKSNAAYGTWEKIEEEPKMEDIDLGLPEVKEELVVAIPVAEPKLKFREKTVSSLGSGPVFFKKPKKKMTAAQFLKKREES